LQTLTYILFVHTYAVYLLAAFSLITGKPVFTLSGCFLLGKTSSWCNVKSISRRLNRSESLPEEMIFSRFLNCAVYTIIKRMILSTKPPSIYITQDIHIYI